MKYKDEKGAVTLEACVSVITFFMISFIFVGMFYMYYAQRSISHALIQASQSLSLEAYSSKQLQMNDESGMGEAISDLIVSTFNLVVDGDESFYSTDNWYDDVNFDQTSNQSILKDRFTAYFAQGDENEADELLTKLGVVGGLDGLDFSNSYISDGDLYMIVEYKMNFILNFGSLSEFAAKQQTKTKLWQ